MWLVWLTALLLLSRGVYGVDDEPTIRRIPNPLRPNTLTSNQVRELAMSRSSAARILQAEMQSRAKSVRRNGDACETSVIQPIQDAIAFRSRQVSAASALKLHIGIAASQQAEQLLMRTDELLELQTRAQEELIERGIPIPDPLLLERLLKTTEDKKLENQSKQTSLRIPLAALIGSEHACDYVANESESIRPSDVEVCEHIREALRCRCDVVVMQRLASRICEETLDCWDNVGATLSGVPVPVKKTYLFASLLKARCKQDEIQAAVQARKRWLCVLIEERSKQITMEVELAFEKKKAAALRWVNAREQTAIWEQRIAQLEEMGRVRGNLPEQFEAKLNRLQAESVVIERWADWHLADIELKLAIGCE
jgi:hypothetical protein